MKSYFSDAQLKHRPTSFLVNGVFEPCPEVPERALALRDALSEAGMAPEAPVDHGLAPIAQVHTPEYIRFLSTFYPRWRRIPGASEEAYPNIHPESREVGYPASATAQLGYHVTDMSCPISADTWEAARWSAYSAVEAAEAVRAGERSAYALCRPCGHHAFKDLAGGFCFLNNTAIAAEILRQDHARVAIVDVDLHHGNGTQGLFYERADVLTVSLHADPVRFYPFFWGYAQERGSGPGLGYNLNLPLPRGTGDEDYLAALERALDQVRDFAPGALVVALGLDAYEGDPFGGLKITTKGFGQIGARIAALGLPTVHVQEGGYDRDALGANLLSYLGAFL